MALKTGTICSKHDDIKTLAVQILELADNCKDDGEAMERGLDAKRDRIKELEKDLEEKEDELKEAKARIEELETELAATRREMEG